MRMQKVVHIANSFAVSKGTAHTIYDTISSPDFKGITETMP